MKTTTAAVTVFASLLAIPAASLDLSPQKLALRGGFSLNPDQGHGGVQVKIGKGLKISGDSRLQFRPSLDLGLGNGVRLVTFDADLVLPFGKGTVRPFVGAGPGLNLIDVTDGVGEAAGTELKLVGNALAGVRWRRWMLEARGGLGDVPDLKVTIGLSF